jgi:hypothetical protein
VDNPNQISSFSHTKALKIELFQFKAKIRST